MPDMSVGMQGGETEEELREWDEFKTIEAFVKYLYEEERETFTHVELAALCFNLRQSGQKVREALKEWDLTLGARAKAKTFRGFSDNPHNRYQGNPMAGGSGIEVNGVGHRFR
jgi:hypothetical protein